ncbi:hypothetical protein GCM10009799_12730 [Nocardiopsis rhodophaea]|uniref:Uncharacterized protein n=1 Tax=Nocardiopsis rhodophaea TaxID=280238 RepID=A0ABN2SKZ4_9ACTN
MNGLGRAGEFVVVAPSRIEWFCGRRVAEEQANARRCGIGEALMVEPSGVQGGLKLAVGLPFATVRDGITRQVVLEGFSNLATWCLSAGGSPCAGRLNTQEHRDVG